MTDVKFDLKCLCCGNKETRAPDNDPEGPACSKCLGPMILQTVTTKRERHRAAKLTRGAAGD